MHITAAAVQYLLLISKYSPTSCQFTRLSTIPKMCFMSIILHPKGEKIVLNISFKGKKLIQLKMVPFTGREGGRNGGGGAARKLAKNPFWYRYISIQNIGDGQTSNLINSLINAINRVTQLLFDTALTRKTFFLVSSRHPLSIYLQCCVSCLISILIVMELTVQERVPIQIRWFNLPWTMPNIINTILFSVTQQKPKNKSRTIQ